MRVRAAVLAIVLVAAKPMVAMADSPKPGCPQDLAQQTAVGVLTAVWPGGEHSPGVHYADPPKGIFPREAIAWSAFVSFMTAAWLGELGKGKDLDWVDKALVSMMSQGLAAIPMMEAGLGTAAMLLAGQTSAIQSLGDEWFPGNTGADVAKRTTFVGLTSTGSSYITIELINAFGIPLVDIAAGPAAIAIGGMAAVVTIIAAIPAVENCLPAPPPVPVPPSVTAVPPGVPNVIPTATRTDAPPSPVPTPIPTCAVGKVRVLQMKTEMEAARQAGKSFNYGGSGDPLSGLIAEVTVICEREAATKPGGTCAEAKDTLAKFRGTVEQACKSDAAWCRASQEELRGVIERTSQTCEREQVVSTPPRQPRPRTASRPRRPPAARVAPQPTGPSPEDVAAAAAIAAGIATIIGGMQRPRGPVYQPPASAPPPRCHYGPDGRLHCGRG